MNENFDFKGNKGFRLIYIFERLTGGELVKKRKLARDLSVSEKSIQRDLQDLRLYLAETRICDEENNIQYDKTRNGYYLEKREEEQFTNGEILILGKVLLNSKGIGKNDMDILLKKLFMKATPFMKKRFEPVLKMTLTRISKVKEDALNKKIWQLITLILEGETISFTFQKTKYPLEIEAVKPFSINFSDDYFFLTVISENGNTNTYEQFRLDKIENINIIKK